MSQPVTALDAFRCIAARLEALDPAAAATWDFRSRRQQAATREQVKLRDPAVAEAIAAFMDGRFDRIATLLPA